MNRRLYKLESKEIKKIMQLFTVLIAVYSLLAAICSMMEERSYGNAALTLRIILLLISALGIIITVIMMAGRFYNILFTDEGLLKISFPVKNSEHMRVNLRLAMMWTGLQILVFIAGISFSEAFEKGVLFGPVGMYLNRLNSYHNNFRGEFMNAPAAKALTAVIIMLAAFAVIVVNIYISFIFTLTVSNRICGKFDILQKKGTVLISCIVMFNIHLLAVELVTKIENAYNRNFLFADSGFGIFGADTPFVADIEIPVVNILIYGITAVVMYRISKNILDKKLDI